MNVIVKLSILIIISRILLEIKKELIKMQTLSVMEFKELCALSEKRRFTFNTDNQDFEEGENKRWNERFYEVNCMANPNRISFRNESGTLTFEDVRFVRLNNDSPHTGELFQIVCRDFKDKERDVSFLIVADKI